MNPTAQKPNILLIQTDQQSAETLGLYGNPLVRTPNLERLAEKGVVFEKAFCNYPACSPSRSSMFTGRYASTIGVHANHMLIDPTEITLPQVLKQHGYQTALIGKNHAFHDKPANGVSETGTEYIETAGSATLREAFDYVRLGGHGHMVDGYRNDPEVIAAHRWAIDNCWNSPLGHGTNPASYQKCGTYLLGETALDYLQRERDPERPFFLWLSFPDPHTPYQTPEPYASFYRSEQVPLPPRDDLSGKPERQRVAHLMDAMDTADDDLIRRVRAIHYGMIRFIDDTVGRVFEKLEELQLADKTVIVFTSDHGDSMGAHGLIQKHNAFYDSFTHVPFIVACPGYSDSKRSTALVELVDVMPTLLELAKAPVPPGVQGRSLAPLLQGGTYTPRECVVIESGEDAEPIKLSEITVRPEHPFDERCFVWCAYREAWYGKGKCIRTHEWKLNLYANDEGELYDLRNDPNELTNLYDQPAYESIQIDLQRKLLLWLIRNEDRLPANDTVQLHYFEVKAREEKKDDNRKKA